MAIARTASRLTAATVYRSGAVVERIADLPAGCPAQVVVGGLPLCLDDASLRLRIDGAAAVVIDAQVAIDPPAEAQAPAPDEAEVRAARRAEAEARARVEALAAQAALLAGVQLRPRPEPQRGLLPAPIPLATRAALLDTVAAELERLAGERAAAAEELRLAGERRAVLEARRAEAGSARPARAEELRKCAIATLRWDGPAVPGGRLVVEYRVPGARWLPSYVVRVLPGRARAEIQLRALVRQRTGEDWEGIALSVSSADAQGWCPLPVLPARRIGRRQEPPATGWRRPPAGAEALYADYDQALGRGQADGGVEAMLAGITPELLARVPAQVAHEFRVLPLRLVDGELTLAVEGAKNMAAIDDLRFMLDVKAVKAVVCDPARIEAGLLRYYGAAPVAQTEELMKCYAAEEARESPAECPPPPIDRRNRQSRRMVAAKPAFAAGCLASTAPAACAPPPAPAAVRDDDPTAWLDYGSLRLAAPDQPRRGRLVHAPGHGALLALFAEARIQVGFSVAGVLQAAVAQAGDVAGDPPGAGWCAPDPAFASRWTAEAPATVPADGGWHLLPVCAGEAAVSWSYVCVPREAREVFRTASFANPFPGPLPAGPADCYLDDAFLVTAPLAAADRGGTVQLGLGVEQGLTVARNVDYQERSAGVFNGTTRAEHRVRLSVANRLAAAVRIELRERLPVAEAEGCAVEEQRVDPPWQVWAPPGRELKGGRRWLIDLAPGAGRELVLEYAITFPARSELAGGNRREA
ncbi:MAG: DUF4139 domain-containing protein [Planctomycetes bacterium]|nr:DUF4139 domain-containing protein [Planctomycetota bacterium]